MGRIFLEHIGDGAPSHLFCCVKCSTVVTNRSELVAPGSGSGGGGGDTGSALSGPLAVVGGGALGGGGVSGSGSSSSSSAFLFKTAVNLCYGSVYDVSRGEKIRDARCKKCGLKLGWFFEFVSDDAERYKEGRVLLERNLVVQLYE